MPTHRTDERDVGMGVEGKVAFELIEGQYFAYLTDCEVKATKPPDPRDQKRR